MKPILAILTRSDCFHLSQGRRTKLTPQILTAPQHVWSTQRKIDSLNAALVGMGR